MLLLLPLLCALLLLVLLLLYGAGSVKAHGETIINYAKQLR